MMHITKKTKEFLYCQLTFAGIFFVLLFVSWLGGSFILLEFNPAKWDMGIRAHFSFITLIYVAGVMGGTAALWKN